MRIVRAFAWMVAVAVLAGGCSTTSYELPPPPPEDERSSFSFNPAEEDRAHSERYLAARTSLLELYNLLNQQRYEEALDRLSQETVDFLIFGSPRDSASDALAAGKLVFDDGRVYEFDPVDLLVVSDLARIEDSVEGIEEHETDRRIELFAVPEDGEPRQIVMIYEGGKWVRHQTEIER